MQGGEKGQGWVGDESRVCPTVERRMSAGDETNTVRRRVSWKWNELSIRFPRYPLTPSIFLPSQFTLCPSVVFYLPIYIF